MRFIEADECTVYMGSGGPEAPAIYVVDLPYHPFDLTEVARGRNATIVRLPIRDWNASLTPWPAPAIRDEDSDFGGQASSTLAELADEAIPAIEQAEGLSPSKRGICGYSLGGLFSLYAFVQSALRHANDHGLRRLFRQTETSTPDSAPPYDPDSLGKVPFAACACLSGSLWYEGWAEYLRTFDFDGTGKYVFLSVGSREKRAALPILRSVQSRTQECARILRSRGCSVDCIVGPGNHFQHTQERFSAGISALDAFLTTRTMHN